MTVCEFDACPDHDGPFDVLAYCRWLDDNANTGAGPRREEEA